MTLPSLATSRLPHFSRNLFQQAGDTTMPAVKPGLLTQQQVQQLDGITDSFTRAARTYKLLREIRAFPEETFSSDFVMDKIMEEAKEVKAELEAKDNKKLESEMGDLLTNMYWLIAETCHNTAMPLVTQATTRYLNRIQTVQRLNKNKPVSTLNEPQFRTLWEQAKAIEKQQAKEAEHPELQRLNLSA